MSEFVYRDNRSGFWKKHFEIAKVLGSYLKEGDSSHYSRWLDAIERTPNLIDQDKDRIQGYNRILNILVYSGIWCGDCVRQVPMIQKIADAAGELVNLRIIEREESPELMEEFRLVGAHRVPVTVFLSEDFWEIGRMSDRTLSVYRAKASRDIGRKYNAGILSPKARERELAEWIDIFEKMLLMVRLSPPLRARYKD